MKQTWHTQRMDLETPREAFHRARLKWAGLGRGYRNGSQEIVHTLAELCELLDTSHSMIYSYESGERPMPARWLPRLPPELAVPVLEALIAQKHDEIIELEMMLRAKKLSRQGGSAATANRRTLGIVPESKVRQVAGESKVRRGR